MALAFKNFNVCGEAQEFIARSTKALNPETQYYALLEKYKVGLSKPEDMRNMALAAMEAMEAYRRKSRLHGYIRQPPLQTWP